MTRKSISTRRAPAARPGTLTHPDRPLWEKQGVTKRGLADFYATIADWILPHIRRRPLALLRCPRGIDRPCFFAKHPWKGHDPAIHPIDTGDDEPMLWIENISGLMALVQASVVELHPWGARIDNLDRPDRLIFDLDPAEGLAWSAVIEAAKEVRQRLTDCGLESFVKTTGGKGLHVVLPLVRQTDWKTANTFTRDIAKAMAKDSPNRYVATPSKAARRGRIFVDYLRNDRGSTAVAAYSTRARPGATVSTPLDWSELSLEIEGDHFTIAAVQRRLKRLKADPWQDLPKLRQRLPSNDRKIVVTPPPRRSTV